MHLLSLRKISISIRMRRRRRRTTTIATDEEASNNNEEDSHASSTPVHELKTNLNPSYKPTWKCFSYEEINHATNGFNQENLVGRGGYAEVYKGVLDDDRNIAVKRLTRASTEEQKVKEFLKELGIVSHVQHPNVSALLGCCIEHELYLIFELSSNGSVSSHLHDKNLAPMAWKVRYKIAVGAARGLHYLHRGCQRKIIHRDIKASNILLTSNFEPQISDFGLARWLPAEQDHCYIAEPIEGTFGCLAPEYFTHGIIDAKTDVFAFGVFLLEIISGRKPVDGAQKSLLSWAKPYLNDGTVEMLVDLRFGDEYDIVELKRLAFAASLCIRTASTWRPSMNEVVELMEDGEIPPTCWTMTEEREEGEDFRGFDYLDEFDTPSSSSVTSS
ncbi:probable receptor-like serine/threonine-protein kinase At5g57670 [Dioscorea cayenensis subsp. rotundata]|uniref:Probable receptor-like serine/threonine-protein kinase At5g57670 n=1 Tax=Dioscorea cayennensis subsp. rotundata TaxID=55577 RepID=A0AB40B1D4_DIOCR|nr:probable receptor-like serine/threonine-protein kinase At5g57670 [Dioscorea cayenensis subsp. rotundata]